MGLTDDWNDADFDTLVAIAKDCSSKRGACDPKWLLSVMWIESGGKPGARNPTSSATGLIQWMGKKGDYFGYTRDQFAALSVGEQLKFARQWFLPYKGKLINLAACYLAVFTPAFVPYAGDDNYVISDVNGKLAWIANANPLFDKRGNNDGKIQIWELASAARLTVANGGPRCKELFARLDLAVQRASCSP
jgi:hypothetical protein